MGITQNNPNIIQDNPDITANIPENVHNKALIVAIGYVV